MSAADLDLGTAELLDALGRVGGVDSQLAIGWSWKDHGPPCARWFPGVVASGGMDQVIANRMQQPFRFHSVHRGTQCVDDVRFIDDWCFT